MTPRDREALRRIAEDILVRAPEVDWIGAKAMRDVLAHEYHDLEVEIVTRTVEADLPALRSAVDRLLA